MKGAIEMAVGTTAALPVPAPHIPIFEKMLLAREPHETDFRFFENLAGRDAVFLDVGANIGNSALSLHFVCPRWRVVSFEPNLSLAYFLSRVADLFAHDAQGRFAYRQIGLADAPGTLPFFMPKIDDWYVVGEASCLKEHFEDETVSKRLSSYSSHGAWSLIETSVQIGVFDEVSRREPEILGSEPTVVVKIDVEGLELHVLKGMPDLIAARRPLFMIENDYSDRVERHLGSLGYRKYEYHAPTNRLLTPTYKTLNSIYLHDAHRLEPEIAALVGT